MADEEAWPTLAQVQRRHVEATMARCAGRKPEAARALGVSLKTLYNHLNLYALRDAATRRIMLRAGRP